MNIKHFLLFTKFYFDLIRIYLIRIYLIKIYLIRILWCFPL